jgi:hypothetical protein
MEAVTVWLAIDPFDNRQRLHVGGSTLARNAAIRAIPITTMSMARRLFSHRNRAPATARRVLDSD